MKSVFDMDRKELLKIPRRKHFNDIIYANEILIIPLKEKHDSGYNLIEIVALDDLQMPICLCGGCCDVLDFTDISCRVDYIEKSKSFHLWLKQGECFRIGWALSTLEIETVLKDENNVREI